MLTRTWTAQWITDGSYRTPKKESPAPMTFRKQWSTSKEVKKATLYSTAIGIYQFYLNGTKAGADYFTPGLTSYKHQLQYQVYDLTSLVCPENELVAVVGGGWAVGRFTFQSRSRITAPRQALLGELVIEYTDGSREVIGTDGTWDVSEQGNFRFADFYDGETFDATVDLTALKWHRASEEELKIHPALYEQYGEPVRAHEVLTPVSCTRLENGNLLYDFGQNFAGVIRATLQGKSGQKVTFRHAEVVVDGKPYYESLRTAKATATYICKAGKQIYSPSMTYMGFRYVEVSGVSEEDIELSAYMLYSDMDVVGRFECSNEDLNKLQANIVRSGKANFIDIPTDCPQRDERMGWTGDLAVFVSTAAFNFDMSRFLDKWLLDMKAEQGPLGGIPFVVPLQGLTVPPIATACWGDSCILVPFAEFMARGNKELIARQYPVIKKYLADVQRWALLGTPLTRSPFVWRLPFQFGDWCAPGEALPDWLGKGPWVATAYFAYINKLTAAMARALGKKRDAAYYEKKFALVSQAYLKKFTDGKGTLDKEFQTGYVLPLYFGMFDGAVRTKMAENLNRLVVENDYHLSTGFSGTPYLLFALADNGYTDTAYKVLLQDTCPSWLYEVRMGATSIWERWDALKPDGTVNLSELKSSDKDTEAEDSSDSMVSFNHYANGAVGDFLYRRVLGLEAEEAGYRTFRVAPLPGGDLTWAKGGTRCPYGNIGVEWRREGEAFTLHVEVPNGTTAHVSLPDGTEKTLSAGTHELAC